MGQLAWTAVDVAAFAIDAFAVGVAAVDVAADAYSSRALAVAASLAAIFFLALYDYFFQELNSVLCFIFFFSPVFCFLTLLEVGDNTLLFCAVDVAAFAVDVAAVAAFAVDVAADAFAVDVDVAADQNQPPTNKPT